MNTNETVEILLVEDSAEDRELTLRALAQARISNRVEVARDGVEALDFIFCQGIYAGRPFSSGPKVILLDIRLPKIDGLEVLRRIRADERTKLIPVVMLTSSEEQSDLVRSYHFGASSYIVKPVNFDSFCKAVQELGLYWLLLNRAPPPQEQVEALH